jgi:hypothetical protein
VTEPISGPPEDKAGDPVLVRAVLGLYPRTWRDRYGDEFGRLMTDLLACVSWRRRIRLVVNAAMGAADAHLRLPGGRAMADRIRGSLAVITCALVVFAIAGAGFQKMTEDTPFYAANRQYSSVGTSFDVLRGAAIAAGIVVLAAALPLVWAVLRQARAGRRADLLALLVAPPVAIAAWLGLAWLLFGQSGRPAAHSHPDHPWLIVMIVLGVGVAALCAWSPVNLLRRAEFGDRLLKAEVVPMIAVTACMAIVTVTDLSWGLAVHASDSSLFYSSNGLFSTYLPPNWVIDLAVLAAATIVAARATAIATTRSWSGPAGARPGTSR